MKISIIVPYLYDGGAERVASIWCNLFADELKENVTLITFYSLDTEYYVSKNCKRLNIFSSKSEYNKYHFLALRSKLKQILVKENFDIIIPFLNLPMVLCSSIHLRAKIFPTIRNNPWKTPSNKFAQIVRDLCIKKAGRVIVQNKEQTKYFSSNKIKKFIVSNPVNPKCLELSKRNINCLEKFVMVGRLHTQKNYLMALNTAKYLLSMNESFSLDIYGDGPEKERLQKEIIEMGLQDSVRLLGNIPNVIDKELDYDCFLMTSDYEGFPNALFEAMGIGMLVISTSCKTGPVDLIEDEVTGFLVEPNNWKQLGDLICRLKNNIEELNKIKTTAKKYIITNYTKKNEIEALYNLCHENE